MMNLVIMAVALLIGAAAQQVLPGLTWLGQAKAPLVLSVVLYYALHRSLALLVTAAIAGGLLCDSLEALPMGYSTAVFCVLGIVAWLYRDVVFSARGVTHMVFGFLAGLGLTFGLYAILLISAESLREVSWFWIALKAIGTALLGMIFVPIVFVILERLDRLTGNIVVESPI
ncbi:MAG: rod shape-determining protein MreD [Verrucomicrobiota bacterium]